MKIICSKYVNGEPEINIKCDSAILKRGEKLYTPLFSDSLEYNFMFAVKIDKVGKVVQPPFAERYRIGSTMAINLWSKELADKLRENNSPVDLAYTFDSSVVIPFEFYEDSDLVGNEIRCYLNGEEQGLVDLEQCYRDIDDTIVKVSQYVTIKKGDIVMVECRGIAGGSVGVNDSLKIIMDNKDTIIDTQIN